MRPMFLCYSIRFDGKPSYYIKYDERPRAPQGGKPDTVIATLKEGDDEFPIDELVKRYV